MHQNSNRRKANTILRHNKKPIKHYPVFLWVLVVVNLCRGRKPPRRGKPPRLLLKRLRRETLCRSLLRARAVDKAAVLIFRLCPRWRVVVPGKLLNCQRRARVGDSLLRAVDTTCLRLSK